jgi:GTP cyclohydrolase II
MRLTLRIRSCARVAEALLPMQDGPTFRAIVYDNSIDQHQHMALVLGDVAAATTCSCGSTRSA